MTTRRNMIKAGAGLAAILATGKAPAAFIKSMVAVRNGIMAAKRGGWENPYVTDGLVAMWDGEWNAGWGVHDSNATAWVDLVGSHDQTIYDRGTSSHHWESNHLVCSNHPEETSNTWDNSYTSGEWGSLAQELSGRKTIEIVCDITKFADAYMGRNYFFGSEMIWNNVGYYWVVKSQLSLGSVITDAPFYSAFVFDEDSAYRYYRNGTLATSATLTADPFSGKSSGDTLNLLFATYAVARIRKTYGVRSYNRVLSASEIAANHAIDKARFNLP